MLIAFHKPYGVLSQFGSDGSKRTLADYVAVPHVYPAGRLDLDSEGLMLLTDDGRLQHAIADPLQGLTKRYLVQVEGIPQAVSLQRLAAGVTIGQGADGYRTRPAIVTAIAAPVIAARAPPIRTRRAIPISWLEIAIHEGRNRQVRRMTAAIGHPTLRLLRIGIGRLDLFALGLEAGRWAEVSAARIGLVGNHDTFAR